MAGTLAVVLVIALAAILFARTAVHALVYAPESAPPVEMRATTSPTGAPPPARLVIPAIGVDAAVQHVGVNAAGNMRAPSNYRDVAWYAPGTAPGETGSAVLAGHFDNGLGFAGVFKRLEDLSVGDDIYVTAEDGSTLHFVVAGRASYHRQEVPVDLLFNRADTVRLNLITCEGNFQPLGRTYDRRLVIFATLVSA